MRRKNNSLPPLFFIVFSIFALFLLPATALSENTPEQLVEEMVADLKESQSPAAILNYVYWPTAFDSFPAEQLTMLNISTPEELKTHFAGILNDPGSFMRDQITEHADNFPEEQRGAAVESMKAMVKEMEAYNENIGHNLARTEYSTRTIAFDENAALIELTSVLDGKTQVSQVELVNIKGNWYLPSVVFVQDQARAGARASGLN